MALKLYWCVFILAFSLCHGSITNAPLDIEACVGDDVNIPWTYDENDSDINSVFWYNGNNVDIMTYFGSGGNHTATNSYNVVNHGNGNITLSNVPIGYTDAYKIDVTAASNSEDVVDVTVCSAPSGLTSSKSGDIITCEATDLGTPAAVLRIWIDGTEQSTSSANVTDSNEVSCCLSGCAVKCMNGGSSSESSSCKLVQVTTTPEPDDGVIIIIIIVIVVVIVIGGIIVTIIVIYKKKKGSTGTVNADVQSKHVKTPGGENAIPKSKLHENNAA